MNMRANYTETARRWKTTLSDEDKRRNGFVSDRIHLLVAQGKMPSPFQGKTPNSPDQPSTARGRRRRQKK